MLSGYERCEARPDSTLPSPAIYTYITVLIIMTPIAKADLDQIGGGVPLIF